MNNKQKFGYTILGAVIMLIGIGVGAIVSPSLTAQRNGVFGEIECTELTVVDTAGNPVVVLGASEQLMSSGTTPVRVKRNGVLVLDPSGKDAVFLSANEGMNSLSVYNKSGEEGEEAVFLFASEFFGNGVIVSNQAGKDVVVLHSIEKGGNYVAVSDQVGKPAVGLYADEQGNRVTLRDKAGNIKWKAP
jgi:hypothetical protein